MFDMSPVEVFGANTLGGTKDTYCGSKVMRSSLTAQASLLTTEAGIGIDDKIG